MYLLNFVYFRLNSDSVDKLNEIHKTNMSTCTKFIALHSNQP